MEGRVRAWCCPFRCCTRVAGVREAWPQPGGCRRKSLGFGSCSNHGMLRLAPTLRVSVARVGQVDVVPVGVSDRQVLLGCVTWPCAVGLYKESFWAGLARPGSSWFMAECAVVGVTSIGRPPVGGGAPAAVVSSPPLRMAGVGLVSRVCGCVPSLQVLWPGAAQGPGGFSRVAQGLCGGY